MITRFEYDTQVLAHRGASTLVPENTIAAFKKAAELGFYFIEFDVMLTADSQVIVFHDETLERTTDGSGKVIEHTYSQIKLLDAGSWGPWKNSQYAGERIPTLHHTLNYLRQEPAMKADVELKPLPGREQELVDQVVALMRTFLKTENHRIIFTSFSVEALRLLRDALPDCALGLLMSEWLPDWQETCRTLNCASVNVNQLLITCAADVEPVKASGYPLLCYTVNDNDRAQELFSWGVDAIFCNNPEDITLKARHRCAI